MTYVKPEIVVQGEREVTEWATPQKDCSSQFAYDESDLVMCNCTNSGARVCHSA